MWLACQTEFSERNDVFRHSCLNKIRFSTLNWWQWEQPRRLEYNSKRNEIESVFISKYFCSKLQLWYEMAILENLLNVEPRKAQHSFQPVYLSSRCIGLWPFTIVYNSNGSIKEARVRLYDCVWFLISLSFYGAALFYYIDRIINDKIYTKSAYISNLIYYISQVTFLLFGTAGIFMDFYNRKHLATILNQFITFDKEVSSISLLNT